MKKLFRSGFAWLLNINVFEDVFTRFVFYSVEIEKSYIIQCLLGNKYSFNYFKYHIILSGLFRNNGFSNSISITFTYISLSHIHYTGLSAICQSYGCEEQTYIGTKYIKLFLFSAAGWLGRLVEQLGNLSEHAWTRGNCVIYAWYPKIVEQTWITSIFSQLKDLLA